MKFVKRWDEDCGKKVLEMQLPGQRKRGRQRRRYLDVVKEDMQQAGARDDEMFFRSVLENMLSRPLMGKMEEEEE